MAALRLLTIFFVLLLGIFAQEQSFAYPCLNGKILIALDRSGGLNSSHFEKQIAFLRDSVFATEWSDLDRLKLIQFDRRAYLEHFGAEQSNVDVRRSLERADRQPSRTPDLAVLLSTVDYWTQSSREAVHLIVFLSSLTQKMVDASNKAANQMKSTNHTLTFVGMGAHLDASLFLQLSPNFIRWKIEEEDVPQVRENTELPTFAPVPHVLPCANRILFAFDSSKSTSHEAFQMSCQRPRITFTPLLQNQMNFLRNFVFTPDWTNFDGLAAIGYNLNVQTMKYGDLGSLDDVHEFLDGEHQSSFFHSHIPLVFLTIEWMGLSSAEDPAHALVFVSQFTRLDSFLAFPIVERLQAANFSFTFVTLNADVDVDLLWELRPADVIVWDAESDETPPDWNERFYEAYGCDENPPFLTALTQIGQGFNTTSSTSQSTPSTIPTTTTYHVHFHHSIDDNDSVNDSANNLHVDFDVDDHNDQNDESQHAKDNRLLDQTIDHAANNSADLDDHFPPADNNEHSFVNNHFHSTANDEHSAAHNEHLAANIDEHTDNDNQLRSAEVQVNFCFDQSNETTPDEFKRILAFGSSQLFADWNHFDRMTLTTFYHMSVTPGKPKAFNSLADVAQWFSDQKQTNNPSSFDE
ncbi:hypothetical protein M3Y99_00462500 [Aphelenchoides fujianensis]|nr:hypothetical protein M3Y99_00462500 [Aphelenchoides fujianensis]